MHVISRRALLDFWERHPESEKPLTRWYRIVSKTDFKDLVELQTTFPTADWVQGFESTGESLALSSRFAMTRSMQLPSNA